MTETVVKHGGSGSDVFVSYASADAAVAASIVEHLERAWLKCWMAPRDVKPGAPYAAAIVQAINEASTLVLALSANSVQSDHVAREIERAASKHKPIIAFRIDAAPLSAELEYFLSKSQWIDVKALGMPAALVKLKEAVGQGSGSLALPNPTVKPAGGMTSRWVILAGAVVVIGLLIALGVRFWSSHHDGAQMTASAGISDKSIAVLPFVDMSEKKDQEYFGDGMAEEILDLLAKIPGLTVIGRTSSFQFKGKSEDLRTIGAKLNAAYVLEGSVRKVGDQVRITAQLIDTRTGAHEWSETYDRPIGDVLKLQDAIAAAVVRELQLTVASGDLNSRSTPKNADAYDRILRGRHFADRSDKEGLDEAVTLFQQALERDPTSADAAAELAKTYVTQVLLDFMEPAEGFERARRAATSAIKLDPQNVLAHVEMAWIHMRYDWDWAGAERELEKAATLAPDNVGVLTGQAELSMALGRWDDALRQFKAALAQDPLDTGILNGLAWAQESRGHLPKSEAELRRVLDIRPSSGYGHYNLGYILLERGDRDGALREMQQETVDEGKQSGLALVYYALGRRSESDAALASVIKNQTGGDAMDIAQLYAFRGQSDEALSWLDRAYAQKDPDLAQIKGEWLLRNLESDPRYKAFLKKMNLPE